MSFSRSAYYDKSSTKDDSEVINALNSLVEKHPRWGFWKLYKVIRKKHKWNHKRVYRVYCQMNLNQSRRAKKRLPNRVRQELFVPANPNRIWSADFMSDSLYCGKRYRTFNVIDDFNREALHIEIDTSLSSKRLVRVFEILSLERGLPEVLRVDNGPEFIGNELVSWAESRGIKIQYIQPGKPNQNAYIERFNRTYRSELLDLYLFNSIEEVREMTYWWMIDYNEKRPHDSLDDLTPAEYMMEKTEFSN